MWRSSHAPALGHLLTDTKYESPADLSTYSTYNYNTPRISQAVQDRYHANLMAVWNQPSHTEYFVLTSSSRRLPDLAAQANGMEDRAQNRLELQPRRSRKQLPLLGLSDANEERRGPVVWTW